MPRDPLVEAAGEKMEYVYSKAQKLVVTHYRDIERYDDGYRISIIAYMKMIVDLMKMEKEAGGPPRAQIPQFNPEELMTHQWKGRKKADGTYAKGSCAWGWDFPDKFSEDVNKALEAGPLQIDQYEFKVEGGIVTAKKMKNPHSRMEGRINSVKRAGEKLTGGSHQ